MDGKERHEYVDKQTCCSLGSRIRKRQGNRYGRELLFQSCRHRKWEARPFLFMKRWKNWTSLGSTLVQNGLMKLDQPEKIPGLFGGTKANNISPLDKFTYGILMNSCALLNDIEAAEMKMKENEIILDGSEWSFASSGMTRNDA